MRCRGPRSRHHTAVSYAVVCTVTMLMGFKLQSNPENTIGVLTHGGKGYAWDRAVRFPGCRVARPQPRSASCRAAAVNCL